MRTRILLLLLPILAASIALPDVVAAGSSSPTPFSRGSNAPSNDVALRNPLSLWSQPPDSAGAKVSSEIVLDPAIASELADDFEVPGVERATVLEVIWWGGEFNSTPADTSTLVFNIMLYEDSADPAACTPGDPVHEVIGITPERSFYARDINDEPIWRYSAPVEMIINGSQRYWLVVQASDHAFPPQWGRLESLETRGCPAKFRGQYFGFPDWVPTADLDLDYSDAAFELNGELFDVPVRHTTWGAVRKLYR